MSLNERFFITDKDRVVIHENNLVDIIKADGTRLEALEPRRLFPVSRLSQYITFLDDDGKEQAVARNMADLDESSREVVSYCLEYYYLVPHITKILSSSTKYGKVHWEVETDRGFKSFDIRNRNHSIRAYKDGHVRVRDSDDNRYIITDYRKLDKHSKKQIIEDI